METRAEYITRNLDTIRELVRMGEVSAKTMNDYKVFCYFSSLKNTSIMQRYSIVAEEMKMKEITVRVAVARMKQRV